MIFDRIFKPNVGKLTKARDIEGLTKALNHKDWRIRQDAVDALGKIKTMAALNSLTEALNDENARVRKSIVEALGTFKTPKVVQPLLEKLKDEDVGVRKETVRSLSKTGEIGQLLELLKGKDSIVCQTAVEALGQTKDPQVIQPLIDLLDHKNDDVRQKAAESLRAFETEDAREAIKSYEIKQVETRIKILDYIVGSPLAKQGYYSNQIGRELVGYFNPLKVVFKLFNEKGRRLGRGRKKTYGFVWPSDWGTDDIEAHEIVKAFEQRGGTMVLIGDHAPYTANLLLAVKLVRALGMPPSFPQSFADRFRDDIEQIVSKLETVSRGEVGGFIYETTVLPFFQRYSCGEEVLIIEDLAEEVSLNALFNFLCLEVIPYLEEYNNLNKFKGRANKRVMQLRRRTECTKSNEEDVRRIVRKNLSDIQQPS